MTAFCLLTPALLFAATYARHDIDVYPFGIQRPGYLPGTLQHIQDMGIGWLEVALQWRDLQAGENQPIRFRKVDDFIKKAQNHSLLLVNTLQFGESWVMRHTGAGQPHGLALPADMAAFKDTLAKLVERYDGDGVEDMPGLIKPQKVWMLDHNLLPHWDDSLENLSTFLRHVSETVRTADPGALLLIKAPAPGTRTHLSFPKFLRRTHPYFDILVMTAGIRPASFEQAMNTRYHGMRQMGIPHPIWVMDAGIARHADAEAWEQIAPRRRENKMARRLIKSFACALANGAHAVFWSAYHVPATQPDDFHALVALTRSNGSATPMAYAYQHMVAKLAHAHSVERIDVDNSDFFLIKFDIDFSLGPCFLAWDERRRNKTRTPVKIHHPTLQPAADISIAAFRRHFILRTMDDGTPAIALNIHAVPRPAAQASSITIDTPKGEILLEELANEILFIQAAGSPAPTPSPQ